MENDLNNGHAAYCATTTLQISATSLYEYTTTFVRHLRCETTNAAVPATKPDEGEGGTEKFRFQDFGIHMEWNPHLPEIINAKFDNAGYGVIGGLRARRTGCGLAKEIWQLFADESLAIHLKFVDRSGWAVGGFPASAASIAKGDTIERGTRFQRSRNLGWLANKENELAEKAT